MDFLIDITKYTRHGVYKKSLIISGFVLLLCTTISCNCNHCQSTNVTENLYVLYLNNTGDKPELAKLLKHAEKNKIVIFQFFHDESGILNLDAWPAKKEGEPACNKNEAMLLHTTCIFAVNITGKNVHLGNLHTNSADYDLLKGYLNKPGFEYIIFVPSVLDDAGKSINHIIYTISGGSSLSITNNNFTNATTPITKTNNPSPPRPANE